MDETEFIWMDGKLVPWKESKIHVLCHTMHYGMGAFEGIRFYKTEKGPAIFRLKDHMDRLMAGAKTCFLDVPFSQEELTEAVVLTVKKNKIDAGYIRPIIYFGYGKMGLPPTGSPVNVAIAVWPWGSYLGDKPVKVKISNFIRLHPKSTHTEAKICGHYVNSIFATMEVKKQGYDEAILLDHDGNVAEGPGENIFIVKDGKLLTPTFGNILPGITRKSIIEIAKDEGIKVVETTIKPKDLYSADEAFYTGTAAEVSSIGSVDDNKLGEAPGPITTKLKKIFTDAFHGKVEKYEKWLSYVK